MDERKLLWKIAGLFLVLAIVFGIVFVTSGFSVVWLFVTATWLVGAFMAFALSFAA